MKMSLSHVCESTAESVTSNCASFFEEQMKELNASKDDMLLSMGMGLSSFSLPMMTAPQSPKKAGESSPTRSRDRRNPRTPSRTPDSTAPQTPSTIHSPKRDGRQHPRVTPRRLARNAASPGSVKSLDGLRDTGETLKVYLIRHGESLGQRACRKRRRTDKSLVDCGLSDYGIFQAQNLREYFEDPSDFDEIDLIITSPLTRAIHTTLLAFVPEYDNGDKAMGYTETVKLEQPQKKTPILVSYELREIGSSIPENQPRKFKEVFSDLGVDKAFARERFDLHSLLPSTLKLDTWPHNHDSPKVVRRDRIREVFVWLAKNYMGRSASRKNILQNSKSFDAATLHSDVNDSRISPPTDLRAVAVVCHYHVIRAALSDPYDVIHENVIQQLHPTNAQPIECILLSNGRLEFVRVLELPRRREKYKQTDEEWMEIC